VEKKFEKDGVAKESAKLRSWRTTRSFEEPFGRSNISLAKRFLMAYSGMCSYVE
jgi:hypothetical protein